MLATSGDPHFYLRLSALSQSYHRHRIVNFTQQGDKLASQLETQVQILPRYEGFVVVVLLRRRGMHAKLSHRESCVDGVHCVDACMLCGTYIATWGHVVETPGPSSSCFLGRGE